MSFPVPNDEHWGEDNSPLGLGVDLSRVTMRIINEEAGLRIVLLGYKKKEARAEKVFESIWEWDKSKPEKNKFVMIAKRTFELDETILQIRQCYEKAKTERDY